MSVKEDVTRDEAVHAKQCDEVQRVRDNDDDDGGKVVGCLCVRVWRLPCVVGTTQMMKPRNAADVTPYVSQKSKTQALILQGGIVANPNPGLYNAGAGKTWGNNARAVVVASNPAIARRGARHRARAERYPCGR